MWVRSLISWLLWVVLTLVLGPLVAIVAVFSERASFHVSRFWARLLLQVAGIKVRVMGVENIPQSPCVYVSNHHSYVDVLALIAYFPINLTFVAKKTLLVLPGLNVAMWAQGHIFVSRGKPSKSLRILRKRGVRALGNGKSILIFPAGERSKDDSVGEFKSGAVALAIWAGVPLMPIAVAGSRQVLPRGNWPLKRGKVIIAVGDEVSIRGISLKQKNEVTEELQKGVENLKKNADEKILIENKKD